MVYKFALKIAASNRNNSRANDVFICAMWSCFFVAYKSTCIKRKQAVDPSFVWWRVLPRFNHFLVSIDRRLDLKATLQVANFMDCEIGLILLRLVKVLLGLTIY